MSLLLPLPVSRISRNRVQSGRDAAAARHADDLCARTIRLDAEWQRDRRGEGVARIENIYETMNESSALRLRARQRFLDPTSRAYTLPGILVAIDRGIWRDRENRTGRHGRWCSCRLSSANSNGIGHGDLAIFRFPRC